MHDVANEWHAALASRRWACGAKSPLLIAAALAVLVLAPALAAATPGDLRLVVAGPGDSAAHRLAEILADPLAHVLGRPVTIEDVPSEGGVAAVRAVVEAAPDGGTLLLADNLLLAVNEATRAWPLHLDALAPVAKLTLGISIALVAPAGSAITSWQSLAERTRRDGLRISIPTAQAGHDVARAMMQRVIGKAFEVVEAADDEASLADLAAGRADIGLVTTNNVEAHAAAGVDLRALVTFGARRSPLYPEVPTFAEVTGNDKNDFTYSFALFGPPGLDDDLTRTLAEATQTACARPAALTAAGAAGVPLACREAEVVEQTLERDLQVARRAYSKAQ